MRKIFIYLILGIAVNLFASEIAWAKDYHEGIEDARTAVKPVLFVSSSHKCKYCVILDNTTFKDARVIEELNKNFVSIISYSDENDYMPQELWQSGTPAIWFLEPSAEPMFQPIMGAIDAENLLEAISIVKKEFNKGRSR
ncbi:thioredoxin family protein [Sulfurimonas sp.]|uniref:thioredoxin family protein n=1 Tax=Sulfurimonas sp. TaxID=2022749 RepID=UPI0025DED5EF|nr:thioredoxin family protein [Sulfurimonas sp.]MBW6487883.1 thioredoxin family protein [Sulfurimonas sp.]